MAVQGQNEYQREEPEEDRELQRELRAELYAIREEEVPGRLLDLARQLQARLRRVHDA